MRENVDLRRCNTFGLPAVAERYLPLTDPAQLASPEFRQPPTLVLGGGSNLLLLEKIPGLTVHVLMSGIAHADGRGRFRVRAGTDWNQFVRYTLDNDFPGLENLILIPGTVGAAPVQNIGAYGAEVAEFITAVHAWEYGHGMVELSPEDCAFGYRDSRFKREPGRFLITAVDFDLSGRRPLKLEYGAITAELEAAGITDPTPRDVANAVTRIRRSKLPDWFFLGNSGSFFKNPVVARSHYAALQADHPDLPAYPIDDDYVKLPAGWLIDRAGLRGAGNEKVGTYERQALVMVNRGGATGRDVLAFSENVRGEVMNRFGVEIEREVQLVPNGTAH
ncbi:UDP-N-acetylmuramate dehydrogenase [Lewinella marina]|uniref:UDP-N-acetylenolpyruvoylglucosamine reductase n=1 Tax=Neolewinella marina TaxID=438751 RepID=A0A2G0CGN5_9BACT|nr:UDP-N-acetylmuramate dehydrogenase [Neolewinella marina]NJB86396.1 UDP-N-acetylmuramate dehydrogenase [Neolewinella marina]PHK99136.1 UDP-N-acetylenolpyruvoylglucosamine reductase [Neolewinella marina]